MKIGFTKLRLFIKKHRGVGQYKTENSGFKTRVKDKIEMNTLSVYRGVREEGI